MLTTLIKNGSQRSFHFNSGAGEESRTLDLNLGKVALYQLSYSRINHHETTLSWLGITLPLL
jgi:hypothetical protein